MSDPEETGEVTYLLDVITKVSEKLRTAGFAAGKLLPGQRSKLIMPLNEAATLLKSVEEVLDRSGMGKRLGFIKVKNGIKPVTLEAVEEEEKDA